MKNYKIKTGLTIILTTLNLLLYAQNQKKLDSLYNEFKKAKHDSIRCRLMLSIGGQYANPSPDTALQWYNKVYATSAKAWNKEEIYTLYTASALQASGWVECNNKGNYEKALEYSTKSFNIFEKLANSSNSREIQKKSKNGMSACFINIGSVHYEQGSYNKAIENYLKASELFAELGNKKGISNCYNNIGAVYYFQGIYDKAIEIFLKSLGIREELGDKKGMSSCYNNIGLVYMNQSIYNKALEYLLQSLEIEEKLGDKKGISYSYNNIGLTLANQGNLNKAHEYFLKSLKIDEKLGDKKGMSECYKNIGGIYNSQGANNIAIEYYSKSLKIDKELEANLGIAQNYKNIASLNISLADSAVLNEKERMSYLYKAIEYGIKAKELAYVIRAMPVENEAANTLMKAYKKLGNYKQSIEYAEIFIAIKDSMFKEEKTKALAGMEAKYQNEKKQLEIDKLGKEKELQLSENKKQRIVIWFVVSGLILLVIIAVLIFRSLRITRKQKRIIEKQKQLVDEKNILLNQQNEEIRTQRDEIETQRDEITAQRDLVTIQKEHIEEIHQEVTDSINYAKRIQQAVLPTGEYANKILGEYFILFKPKDVVSGDFYWATRVNEWLIITVADCTGHGVPGAFMSMLGISFLNEIVRKKEVTQASHVLDNLRDSVIDALKQKGSTGEQKDGMDLVLVVINTITLELQFAGANNPLWIVKIQNDVSQQTILEELKPDKMPVAIHERMDSFTNHIIQLQKGDTLYLASDGYEDQFGGTKHKKFLSKNMKELIKSNSQKQMNEQKEILETTIVEWIGNGEQIDDITVMGIMIG